MRFVPTPTARPIRVAAVSSSRLLQETTRQCRVPHSIRPYVSLNLRVAGQRTNVLAEILFQDVQQQIRRAAMLLFMIPRCW